MNRRISFIFPCLFVLAIVACRKPAHIDSYTAQDGVLPIVLYTSLKDSLPPKAIAALKCAEVGGIKINYVTGRYASYFEYEADKQSILAVMARLPFSKNAALADTTCRRLSRHELELIKLHLPNTELENSESFWNASAEEFDVYECVKTPLTHTLLISKNSNRILHRIEFTG